jgi:membrane fusion protein, multidrug efflux system
MKITCSFESSGTRSSAPVPVLLQNLVAVVTALFLLASCSSGNAEKQKTSRAAPVTISVAATKNVPVVINAIGTAGSYSTVSVRAQITGEITDIAFKQGQDVSRGDLLFTIDPRPYQAALEGAFAALARDKAMLKNAESDVRRYGELVKKDYVTSQQYDQAVANAEALKATVAADEAAIKTARLNLDYCTVRAPVSGRTGDLLLQKGNVIKANDQAVVTINQITPIYVSFSVPEEYLPDIRRYAAEDSLRVEAAFPGEGGNPYQGHLTFINNTVDESTGTILLKATFQNRNKSFWPGQFVNVTLRLATSKNAVVVPSQAVQRGQKGDYVFVVKPDMTVEMRSIETGQHLDGETVIRTGIEVGDKVVTDGQLRLFPGARIEIAGTRAAAGTSKP